MLNFKDLKVQKKIVYSTITVVLVILFGYSGWFLYNNFYNTINWKEDVSSSLQNEAIIRHVDLKKMKDIVAGIEQEQEAPNDKKFNINLEIR